MTWIALSDWLLQLINDSPLYAPLSSLKGLLFVAITAALLYLLLRKSPTRAMAAPTITLPSVPKYKWLILLAGLVLIVPLLGVGITRIHGAGVQQQAYATLKAIRDLKAEQLEQWLNERRSRARVLSQYPEFRKLARPESRPLPRKQLDDLLRPFQPLLNYTDAALLDTGLNPVVPFRQPELLTPELLSTLAESPARTAHYNVMDSVNRLSQILGIPISLDDGAKQTESALLLLEINLESLLGDVIGQWPTDSASGELLLLRSDSQVLTYLSQPRLDPSASRQVPLSGNDTVSARAVHHDQAGIIAGLDYRGSEVLAAYRPVADSGWFLLTKLDRSEVMAPIWELAYWVSLITLTTIAAMAIMLLMLWRQTLKARYFELQTKADGQDRLLRKFYELPFVGMAVTSPITKQSVHCNDRLCEILGYSREELQSINWVDLTHPDDLNADLNQFELLLQGKSQGYSLEKRFYRKDRSLGYARIDIKGIYREDGSLEYLITTLEDITERKQLEHTLRQREAEYRQLFTANPLPMWVHDRRTGRIMAVNQAAIIGYGYDRDQFLSMHVTNLLPEGTPAGQITASRRHRTRHGRLIDVELFCHPITFAGSNAELVLANDITQRRQQEEDLRLAATVFENAREGVLITDPETRIIKANQALCSMFGYRKEELLGKTPALFNSGRHDRAFFDMLWQTITETGHWQGEIWSRRQNGEIFPELSSISAVRDQYGNLTHYVGILSDISRLKATEEKLEFLANRDPLTRLPNRRLLFSRLEQSLKQARRQENPLLALLMLDLDRFKDVNDSFGHLAGDELLQEVATRLGGLLRASDTLARLGGDEFVLLMEHLSEAEDAGQLADRLITSLNQPIALTNEAEIRIGASVGISLFPDHGQTPEQLLQQADAALYHAKEQGRGRFSYYTDEFTMAARQRLDLEARLRRACLEQQFQLHYQPQVDIHSGTIIAAEALIRWQDPERGLIPPGKFIPVAEHTGIITQIGEWVLWEACRQGRQWLDAGLPPLNLSLNLSPVQLRHGNIAATLEQVLAATGFPAQYLTLELTESTLMSCEQDMQELLGELRAQGIHLAIDDFGTGYSSLAYLKHFPINALKIDKSFVDDIQGNPDSQAIAATIVAMGHTLGLKVLAEGVETNDQLIKLQQLECDYYQGYFKSRPLPADQFVDLLTTSR